MYFLIVVFSILWTCLSALAQVGVVTKDVVVSETRKTSISIFYPAEKHTEKLSWSYLSFKDSKMAQEMYWQTFYDFLDKMADQKLQMTRERFTEDLIRASSKRFLPVKIGALPRFASQRRPVILYSPGFGFSRNTNFSQVIALVQEGFVVVTVDHPYTGIPATTLLENGEVLHCSIKHPIASFFEESDDVVKVREILKGYKKIFELRQSDIRATVDFLEDFSKDPKFFNVFDLRRVGIFGQSNGGATSVLSLVNDQRIAAAVNMDGSLFSWMDLYEKTEKPLLMLFEGDAKKSDLENLDETDMNASFAKRAIYSRLPHYEHIDFTSIRLFEQDLNYKLVFTDNYHSDPVRANLELSRRLIQFFKKNL